MGIMNIFKCCKTSEFHARRDFNYMREVQFATFSRVRIVITTEAYNTNLKIKIAKTLYKIQL